MIFHFQKSIKMLMFFAIILTSYVVTFVNAVTIGTCERDYDKTTTYIYLGDCKLSSFDNVFPNALSIDLRDNKLTEVPKSLSNVLNLQTLWLSGNQITSFPSTMRLPQLTYLYMKDNPMQSFDFKGVNIAKLLYLDMSNSSLTQLPSLSSLTVLTTLVMERSNITTINVKLPQSLMDLEMGFSPIEKVEVELPSALTTLNLNNCQLQSLNIKFPTSLRYLSLENNFLTEIPSGVYSIPDLVEINLLGNPIEPLVLTQEQFMILNGSINSKFTLPEDSPPCAEKQVQKVMYTDTNHQKFINVCVTNWSDTYKIPTTTIPLLYDTILNDQSSEKNSSTIYVLLIVILFIVIFFGRGIYWIFSKLCKRNHFERQARLETPFEYSNSVQMGNAGMRNAQEQYVLDSIPMHLNEQSLLHLSSSNPLSIIYGKLQTYRIDLADIKDIKRIGSGGFAIVWLVLYKDRQYVASKRLRTDELQTLNSQQLHSFAQEIQIVSMLKHANIVEFLGVAWDDSSATENLQMLFEYMEGGDLRDCLQKTLESNSDRAILHRGWSRKKVEIARDISSALVYVHSFRPPILHRDIKARNVLLSSNAQTAKLSDFGVSRIRAHETTSMTANVGTARWLAPEVANGSTKYNESTDIYSFGMLLSELDSHEVPFSNVKNQENEPLREQAVLVRLAMGILDPIETFDSVANVMRDDNIYHLAKQCLARNPKDRPTAMDVAQEINQILNDYM